MEKRKIVEASKIIVPTFNDEKERGCKNDKNGKCPMISDLIPSKENGCDFCRKVKETWLTRNEILNNFEESKLKDIKYYDLEEDDYIRKVIHSRFNEIGFSHPEILFDFVKQYCSFENDQYAIKIENEGQVILDGRHRIKIAQNLNITIPVHWG